jgi:hypothetical protein
MSQLKQQIFALDESLSGFKSADLAEWRVGEMANVLLAQARDNAPDDPVIKSIPDFPRSDKMFVADAKIGTIRATLRQAAEALPDDLDRLKAQRQRRLSGLAES